MQSLRSGQWLGIDIGSARNKLCSYCLIVCDGQGGLTVAFEQGPATTAYPSVNTKSALVDAHHPPTYLLPQIEAAVIQVLRSSDVVRRWFEGRANAGSSAIAVDAPVALACGDGSRLTEQASTQTFRTPGRRAFETLLQTKADPYLRVNCFWKCIGFAVYRELARRLDAGSDVAAWTCPDATTPWQLRETFPSDVYKRANGLHGRLHAIPRHVLQHLVQSSRPWQRAGDGPRRPTTQTLQRLDALRNTLRRSLEGDATIPAMRKRDGTLGDLWDAFTCAFTACCESHDGAVFHGIEGKRVADTFHREGAIMTVRSIRQNFPVLR